MLGARERGKKRAPTWLTLGETLFRSKLEGLLPHHMTCLVGSLETRSLKLDESHSCSGRTRSHIRVWMLRCGCLGMSPSLLFHFSRLPSPEFQSFPCLPSERRVTLVDGSKMYVPLCLLFLTISTHVRSSPRGEADPCWLVYVLPIAPAVTEYVRAGEASCSIKLERWKGESGCPV